MPVGVASCRRSQHSCRIFYSGSQLLLVHRPYYSRSEFIVRYWCWRNGTVDGGYYTQIIYCWYVFYCICHVSVTSNLWKRNIIIRSNKCEYNIHVNDHEFQDSVHVCCYCDIHKCILFLLKTVGFYSSNLFWIINTRNIIVIRNYRNITYRYRLTDGSSAIHKN